jgi:calmodulin
LGCSEYKEPETEDELIEAMQSIFKPKGATITVKEFKNVMTNLGEKLTEDELTELFKELKMEKEDNFNYEEFIKTILTR